MKGDFIEWLGIIYICILLAILLFFVLSATISIVKLMKEKEIEKEINIYNKDLYIDASLLVPAFNEELTIESTVESLLDLNYRNYEIIIISDGSTDRTVEILKNKYNLKLVLKKGIDYIKTKEVIATYKGQVRGIELLVIDKVNGGKADALNVGINYSSNPVFVAVDADSILEKEALKNILKPFLIDKRVIAVGGNIKISNFIKINGGQVVEQKEYDKLIPSFQVMEYLRAFFLSRMAFNTLNMNFIISGAFGAFKKDVVIKCGGYRSDTIGEDMELVMRLHKKYILNKEDYKIFYTPDAICFTQAPNTMKGVKTQRKRWQIGLMHSILLHNEFIPSIKWNISKWYFVFFELITPIVEMLSLIVLVACIIIGKFNLNLFIFYSLLIIGNGLCTSYFALILDSYFFNSKLTFKNKCTLLCVSLLEGLGYRQIVSIFRMTAFFNFNKNKKSWGTIKREKMLINQ